MPWTRATGEPKPEPYLVVQVNEGSRQEKRTNEPEVEIDGVLEALPLFFREKLTEPTEANGNSLHNSQ